MNIAGLEWFGPPERNTLRPLCVVCLCSQEVENGIVRSESELVLCLPWLGLRECRECLECRERLPSISQGRCVYGR